MTTRRPLGLALLLVLVLVAGPAARAGDADGPVVPGALGRKVEEAVRRAGGPDFWGSVLVARDGEVLLAKGYGFADYEGTPNTPSTLFELASASKGFTAAAILDLVQHEKLALDDTLDRFFPGVPKDKRRITVHQLLTHTAGIGGDVGVGYASPIRRRAYVRRVLSRPLSSEPGTRFEYANAGYALLAAIVEEVTKRTFETVLEKRLFRPAGMKDTGFLGDRDLIASKRASVRRTTEPGAFTAADWHWGWGYRGMGGVVTTVLDLERWDRALRGDAVLSAEAKRILFAPRLANYACGWLVEGTPRGTRKAHHSGSVAGYGTNLVRYLDEDAFIAVLSNDPGAAQAVTAAVEPLLFEPVRIRATIDRSSLPAEPSLVYPLPSTVAWAVAGQEATFALELRNGADVIVSIRAPKSYARGLASALEPAIAARAADDATDGDRPRLQAGLYLQAYDPNAPALELGSDAAVVIRPEYRGRDAAGHEVVDRRVLLVLEDPERGMWPLMVQMNVEAARALLDGLRGVF